MTKAQIQALINQIDTTGSNGTTGQELKDIHEAFKNELDDYVEVLISSADLLQIGSVPKQLLASPGSGKFYLIKSLILEYKNYGVVYNATATFFDIKNDDYGSQPIYTSDTNLIKFTSNQFQILNPIALQTNLLTANTPIVMTTNNSADPTVGNGEITAKITYKKISFNL